MGPFARDAQGNFDGGGWGIHLFVPFLASAMGARMCPQYNHRTLCLPANGRASRERSAARWRCDAFRREFARVGLHGAPGQRREHDANGFARGVGPAERTRGAGMAEGLLRTAATAGPFTNGKSQ